MGNRNLKGIDISVYNGVVDFARVKASGIDFVYIKASQGREVSGDGYLFTDRNFHLNIRGANAAGLAVGVYHYLTAATEEEAEREADFYIKTISPYRDMITLGAAIDVEEGKYLPASRRELSAVVERFAERLEAAGFASLVYTNPNYLKNRFDCHRPLWLALWRDESDVPLEYSPTVWQYSDSGRVEGIIGNVDMNIFLGDAPTANAPPDKRHWGADAIDFCRETGLMKGDENGQIDPDSPVSRAELAVILERFYNLELPPKGSL